MANWYFLLKKHGPGVDDIRMLLANKHAVSTENSFALRQLTSADDEEILVSMSGVSSDWIDTQDWVNDPLKCVWNYRQGDIVGNDAIVLWKGSRLL